MKSSKIAALAAALTVGVVCGSRTAAAQEQGDRLAASRTSGGVTVGLEVGEPTSLTAGYRLTEPRLWAGVAVGTGVYAGHGVQLRAELRWSPIVWRATPTVHVPVHIGLGLRHYQHRYEPASIDELPDTHIGVRAPLGIGVSFTRLGIEAYGDLSPGYDLGRDESCSLRSGALAVCPHSMSSRVFTQWVFGVRYVL